VWLAGLAAVVRYHKRNWNRRIEKDNAMISAATMCHSEGVQAHGIGSVFGDYRAELEWLANFLTGDEKLAAACVIDACTLAYLQNPDFEEWLRHCARLATMRSAFEIQRSRIAQLSTAYMRRPCIHGGHKALSEDSFDLVVEESNVLVSRLDVLCRCALVLCGIEKQPAREAAFFLGVDPASVENAYCVALHFLEVTGCEQLQRQDNLAAICN
jgi:DNA-directed RNA polymerase specialized sigma24 family protein